MSKSEPNGTYSILARIERIDETIERHKGDKTYYERPFIAVYDKERGNGEKKETPLRFIVKGQDACAKLDNFQDGDAVKIRFDLDGYEYNEKVFVNLVAWAVTAEEWDEKPRKPLEQTNRGKRYVPPALPDKGDDSDDEIDF